MNKRKIVNATNKIALTATCILLYWILIFSVSTVYEFKVFEENITQLFTISIMGIIGIMFSTLIVNIMFNLTIIADNVMRKDSEEAAEKEKKKPIILWIFIASFPLVCGLLYLGDVRTNHVKEKQLVESASFLVKDNLDRFDIFAYDTLDSLNSGKIISLAGFLSKQDNDLGKLDIIVQDKIDNKNVYLRFDFDSYVPGKFDKASFIYSCSKQEREYLNSRYSNETKEYLYEAKENDFELHYPVVTKKRLIILHFTDYKRYGSFGS